MNIARLLVLASTLLLPLASIAQWQWIDKDNRKVFSDQGPPPEIPEKNILRRPGSMRVAPAAAPAASTEPGATPAPLARAATNGAKPTGVDKELEGKARKTEEAEKAKKAAEDQKVAKARAENCERAQQGKRTFETGIRVARVNSKGEREIMTDEQRAAEQQRLQSVIASDCK